MVEINRRLAIGSAAAMAALADVSQAQAPEAEEFIGPLPGWLNARTDFGAVGDGRADDTAALQRALDALVAPRGTATALYIPAGRYRITRTLVLPRRGASNGRGLCIQGEDPTTTVIIWDGPRSEGMLEYGAWYSALGRLTFDGAGRAATALFHGTEFVTANEIADCVFTDVGVGIEAGSMAHSGIAETSVLRCRFIRCATAGASLRNFNSLDWWFWQCRFEDCGTGLTNIYGAGNFYANHCVFLRSREADIAIRNTGYLSFRDNLSIGSKAFFVGQPVEAGCLLTFQRNQVFDSTGPAIRIGNLGPVTLMDNLIVSRAGQIGPAVDAASAIGVAIGNGFTVSAPLVLKPGSTDLDTAKVARGTPAVPPPTPFARRFAGAIVPIPVGADTAAIQASLTAASRRGAAVHFAPGTHKIDRTLTIPNGSRLVGDGMPAAARLEWAGQDNGPVLRLASSSRVKLRGLVIVGSGRADGIEVSGSGQVFFDQTMASGCVDAGYHFEHLGPGQVLMRDIAHGDSGVGVRVVGRGTAESQAAVVILSGASSNNEVSYALSQGARLLARDIWYESGTKPGFMRLSGPCDFCLNGSNIAAPRKEGSPAVVVEGLKGRALFLGVLFTGAPEAIPALVVQGAEPASNLLLLGCHGYGEFYADRSSGGRAARLHGLQYTPGGGAKPIADRGRADAAFLRGMLEMARAPIPRDTATVRLSRVFLERCRVGARVNG